MPLSDSEIRLIWVHVHVLLKMLADLNYDVMYVSCNTNGVKKKNTFGCSVNKYEKKNC